MLSKTKLAALISIVVCALSLVSGAASAQTTANGPYYATPSWDQKLQCDSVSTCPRFLVLANWNSEAVLDRETGLVWQRSLGNASLPFTNAVFNCTGAVTGARRGWRLPSIQELFSLLDTTTLLPPVGHPFLGAFTGFPTVWSASSFTGTPGFVQIIILGFQLEGQRKDGQGLAWCVRGGSGYDIP